MGAKHDIKLFGFRLEWTPGKYWRFSRKTDDGWLLIKGSRQKGVS